MAILLKALLEIGKLLALAAGIELLLAPGLQPVINGLLLRLIGRVAST